MPKDLTATSSRCLPPLTSEPVDRARQPGRLLAGSTSSIAQSPAAKQLAPSQPGHSLAGVSKPEKYSDSRRHADTGASLDECPHIANRDLPQEKAEGQQCRRQPRGTLSPHSSQEEEQRSISRQEGPRSKMFGRQRKAPVDAVASQKSAVQRQSQALQMQSSDLRPSKSMADEALSPISRAVSRPKLKGKQQAMATRLVDRHLDHAVDRKLGEAAARETDARGELMMHSSDNALLPRPGSNKRKSPDFHSPSPVSGYEIDANLEAGRKLPRQDSASGLPGISDRPYERFPKGWKLSMKEESFMPECDTGPQAASNKSADARSPKQVRCISMEADLIIAVLLAMGHSSTSRAHMLKYDDHAQHPPVFIHGQYMHFRLALRGRSQSLHLETNTLSL